MNLALAPPPLFPWVFHKVDNELFSPPDFVMVFGEHLRLKPTSEVVSYHESEDLAPDQWCSHRGDSVCSNLSNSAQRK